MCSWLFRGGGGGVWMDGWNWDGEWLLEMMETGMEMDDDG